MSKSKKSLTIGLGAMINVHKRYHAVATTHKTKTRESKEVAMFLMRSFIDSTQWVKLFKLKTCCYDMIWFTEHRFLFQNLCILLSEGRNWLNFLTCCKPKEKKGRIINFNSIWWHIYAHTQSHQWDENDDWLHNCVDLFHLVMLLFCLWKSQT